MFRRQKDAPKKKGGGEALMAQMGFSLNDDMDDLETMTYGDVLNDEELLAELAALEGESSPSKRSPEKGSMAVKQSKMNTPDDEDMSDVDDPDLLAELQELTTKDSQDEPIRKSFPSASVKESSSSSGTTDIRLTIEERLDMYIQALDGAKSVRDTTKCRRMERGIKTLNELLKKVNHGQTVNEEDLPPLVARHSGKNSAATTPTENSKPLSHPKTPDFEPTIITKEDNTTQPIKTVTEPTRTATVTEPTKKATVTEPTKTATVTEPTKTATATEPTKKATVTEPTKTATVTEPTISTSVKPSPSHSKSPAPSPPKLLKTSQLPNEKVKTLSAVDAETLHTLSTRQEQYKISAMRAKQAGNRESALKYFKIAKQFDKVITAIKEGKPIDLNNMPPAPPGYEGHALKEMARTQASASQSTASPSAEEDKIRDLTSEENARLFNAPETASSVMEALIQRLEKYKSSEQQAKTEGNNSKARRMGRIVKQYQEAINATKSGKVVNYEELPTPPGFPPIPEGTHRAKPASDPEPPPKPKVNEVAHVQPTKPCPTQPSPVQRQTSLLSRSEKQTMFLQERQLMFKKAAVKAKNNGDMELAKKYLRMAKGFDQMIEASQCGLPVNMTQVPSPPESAKEDFEFVNAVDDSESDTLTGDRNEMYKKLEQELIKQIRMCSTNAEHFTQLGDVSSASKFDKMGQNARRDLDSLKSAYKHGDPVPRFRYETRTFSLVQSCTDLGDNDLEICLVRGINFGLPSDYKPTDLDTYVKFEFPYPSDDTQKACSETKKGTNNPEYNQNFKININRKARVFLRTVKNKSVKFEIYYRRGFLKSDKLLGIANVKLQPLENICVYHQSFELQEGRKTVGGKLEIKIRIRDPFLCKQVEETKEKWLVIESYERTVNVDMSGTTNKGMAVAGLQVTSMEVLKYEKQLLDRQIQSQQRQLSRADIQVLTQQSKLLQQRLERQKEQLKQGGKPAVKAYLEVIEETKKKYLQEAQVLVKKGNKEKAQIMLNKKKLVEKEVDTYTAYLQRI